jgi:hypothetical protein
LSSQPRAVNNFDFVKQFLRKIFLLLIYFVFPLLPKAQIVNGVVLDGHTREPIAFASVYFSKAGNGMLTDSLGRFAVTLSTDSTDSLIVSYVGYETGRLPVLSIPAGKTLLVEMERGIKTGEVVIRAKVNKGLFLWKKIMSKKKMYNRYNFSNFAYESYNKLEVDLKNFNAEKAKKNFLLKPFSFVFDNIDSTSENEPFLPAYLVETLSDYAYQRAPKRFRETIKATQTKGFKNESITRLLGVMDQNVNVYSNFVNIMDKDFISPFNDNADVYYNFNVADTQIVNGSKIFHFTFRPKRPGQNTFQGEAYVIAGSYQIQKLTMYIGKEANINFIDRLSIFQEYHPLNDSIYFLTRDKFFADFRVLGKNSLTLIGRKTTSYKNIAVNADSITEIFKDQNTEEQIITLPHIHNFSDSTWKTLRHDSLSTNEKAIYSTIDKLLDMPKFQKLQTTLRFIGTGYRFIGNYEIGPWFNWISANAQEGTRFRFDLGTNTGFNKKIYLHGYLAYGTQDKTFKGKAEAYWILNREPNRFRLHASWAKDIDNGISQFGEVSQDNIFTLAIRKPNTKRKFIRLEDYRFEIFKEWGRGFSTEWFMAKRQFTPLLNLPPKSNYPVEEGAALTTVELALKLRFAYLEQFLEGDYFRYSLGTKYPVVELVASKSFKILEGAYDYTKISATIRDKVRISPLGTLSYKVYGGKVFGTLPFMFLEVHPGNDIYYYNTGSFNLMNRFEYVSDQYAGFNLEHNIGSGIFRFTPVTRKLKWRQFWNVKTVWGSASNANKALNGTQYFKYLNGSNYTEIGTGIDNIFRVFRLDFVWRLNPAANTPRYSRFGVFGSFQFQF